MQTAVQFLQYERSTRAKQYDSAMIARAKSKDGTRFKGALSFFLIKYRYRVCSKSMQMVIKTTAYFTSAKEKGLSFG